MIKLMLIGQWLDFPVKKAQERETEQPLIREITESGLAHLYRVLRMPALLIAGKRDQFLVNSRSLSVCQLNSYLLHPPPHLPFQTGLFLNLF